MSWQLGNTSVRSAMRLRDGLIAIKGHGTHESLRGVQGDELLREILGHTGVVNLGEDITVSVGRKWRAALCKLGFLYDDLGAIQSEVGPIDQITPNGLRLIEAESLAAQQECFLRAIAGMFVPVAKGLYNENSFSPLRHVLRILTELEEATGDSKCTLMEVALFVQGSNESDETSSILEKIFKYRLEREIAKNKKSFDNNALKVHSETMATIQQSTYIDYADMNLRYLKATGLFRTAGRGIMLDPSKREVIRGIVNDLSKPSSTVEYYKNLTQGSSLPTDDEKVARLVLRELEREGKKRGLEYSEQEIEAITIADLTVSRFELEQIIALDDERKYSRAQANDWREIAQFMDMILEKRKEALTPEGVQLVVPTSERAAYFEWTLWRAFLAINSLANLPEEARRFKVDRDMLPLGCAPGGGPDLIFEFDDFVLVVEVTLLDSDRQEAAEGTPVRKHVYEVGKKYEGTNKPVYCLFLAPKLYPATVETFRTGSWFDAEHGGIPSAVTIVPLALSQFRDLFVAMFEAGEVSPSSVRSAIVASKAGANETSNPMEWARMIESVFSDLTSSFS